MSALDLTEAVEVAAAVDVGMLHQGVEFDRVPIGADVAAKILAAAAPLIERQVREQVACEIEAVDTSPTSMDFHFDAPDLYADGLAHAARIARDGA